MKIVIEDGSDFDTGRQNTQTTKKQVLCFDVMTLERQGRMALYTEDLEEYLKSDVVIDHDSESVEKLADELFDSSADEMDFIRKAYEYVRDNIAHSADAGEDKVTISASEVLASGHGICFAKSHLLAAILRSKGVPAGFCYQKLILDDETAPVLIYHGLNGVYISSLKKWIRLDARGNKQGVNAQFSTGKEQLAFEIRPEKGEKDCFMIYPDPDILVLQTMREAKTRSELWDDLPAELGYNKQSR